jgi:lipopolysaccharide export system ATP-binding protein
MPGRIAAVVGSGSARARGVPQPMNRLNQSAAGAAGINRRRKVLSEAGLRSFSSYFRSPFGGWRRPGSRRIDLDSLGGPIPPSRTESMNLPDGRKRQPRKRSSMEAGQQPRQGGNGAEARVRSPDPVSEYSAARLDSLGRSMARETCLATHGIEKSFGGRKVVKGASIYVQRGEAVGLLGPNGAGKTTVFYMITGLIRPDRGHIELDGNDVTKLPMYQRARLGIGYLPQEASIFRGLNVEDNIRAVLEVVEGNRRRREADLNSLLEEFNIGRLRRTPSIALSGGERRRVEIARALATRPSYMLLDEPFAGIDPIAVGDIQALVRHLTNRGIGVLITDHNVRETLGLTDRAYIIYSGSVLMEGHPEEIVNDPDVRRLYLGDEFRM